MGIFDRTPGSSITPPIDDNDDRDRLAALCGVIDKGIRQFQEVGLALEELRDRALFKITHSTFAAFCEARWKMSESHATRLIQAADLCRKLGPNAHLVENERQARRLNQLPPEYLAEAVTQAAATQTPIAKIADAILPTGKRRSGKKKPRPLKFKLPGFTLTIEPNGRFPGIEEAARLFAEHIRTKNAA